MKELKDTLNIFLPMDEDITVKSNKSNKDSSKYIIAGYASTPDLDFQGEQVDPIGIDDSYFKNHGWIDYEHDTDKVIGLPSDNTFTDSDKGLYVEAVLFKDNPYVQDVIKLEKNLKAVGSDRKLGFSIEGQVIARDEINPSIIRQVKITGVAVTKTPANVEATWEVVQKSNVEALQAGYGTSPETQLDGGALRPESIAGYITNLSYALNTYKPKELDSLAHNVASILNERDSDTEDVAPLFLQVFKGLSKERALSILKEGNTTND